MTEGIRVLLALKPATDECGDARPHILSMESAALDLFNKYRARIKEALQPGNSLGDMQDWGGKLCGAVAQIAGVLHLAEHGDTSCTVARKTIAAAIRIGDYLTAHALAAFAEMGTDADHDNARVLLAWIRRTQKTEFSKRDAQRDHKVNSNAPTMWTGRWKSSRNEITFVSDRQPTARGWARRSARFMM